MRNSEAVEVTVDIIIEELNELNESILEQLSRKAPETTQKIKIFLGRKNHIRDMLVFGEDLNYREFIGAVIISYLENRGVETDSSFELRFLKDIDWEGSEELSGGLKGGAYFGEEYMFTSIMPFNEVKNVEKTLEGALEGSNIKDHLKEFLRCYLELMDEEYRKSNYRTLKNIISHELTHYFIRKNTKIGDLRDRAQSEELREQVDAENMAIFANRSNGIVNVRMQAQRISNNTTLTSVEEIFCFFVANSYTEKNLARDPEHFSHSY
ncbi:MAG: hypothetical protein J07AB43_16890, partial [Candidatus Nanosalina sp. J07AB43]